MEIITYVRQGAITHEDSLGHKGRTEAGDVQVMSAGSGIRHAEYNREAVPTTLFQIWIEPGKGGGEPSWGAKPFPKANRSGHFVPLASGFAGDDEAQAFKRIANAVLKYWISKRAPWHAVECLESLGGNGYVEESGMPRLYREAPLASIWEGSGNVQCLDVMRAMVKNPESVEAFANEVGEGAVLEPRLDRFAAELRKDLQSDPTTLEARARSLVERMALALQGSVLVRFGDEAVAEAFITSRLEGDWGHAFGTLPAGTDFQRIINRHRAA
jgi:hypothetical protein